MFCSYYAGLNGVLTISFLKSNVYANMHSFCKFFNCLTLWYLFKAKLILGYLNLFACKKFFLQQVSEMASEKGGLKIWYNLKK